MPANYNGIPSNIVIAPSLTVSGTSLGGTVTVATSTAHGLSSGDAVDITGVQGNAGTNVNAVWTNVTVTGGATFTIPTASSGTYSGGGTVQPLTLGGTAAIPSPGDAGTAVSVDTMFKRLSDQTAFLGGATGVAKLAGRIVWHASDPNFTQSWAARSVTAVANTWYALNSSSETLVVDGSVAGCLTAASITSPIAVSGWDGNLDTARVTVYSDALASGAVPARFGLFYGFGPTGGAAPSFPGGYSQIPYLSQYVTANNQTVSLEGIVPHVGYGGTLYIQPAVYSLAVTGSVTWGLGGDVHIVVDCWRVTGVGQ